jgi:hypothetical protein
VSFDYRGLVQRHRAQVVLVGAGDGDPNLVAKAEQL